MSAISGFINTIRNAVYGEQVRGAIINALEQCYSDVESPSLNQAAFTAAINAAYAGGILDIVTVTQISQMTNQKIIYRYNGTEAGKQKGLYYYSALSSSWVLIGSEIHSVSNSNQMTDTNAIYKYTGTQTGMIQNSLYCYNGTAWIPIGSGVLTASTKAAMTNQEAIYKYTGSENGMLANVLYYYNGADFVPLNDVLRVKSGTSGRYVIYPRPRIVTSDGSVSAVDGAIHESQTFAHTDYFEVHPDLYGYIKCPFYMHVNSDGTQSVFGIAFYDADKVFISGFRFPYSQPYLEGGYFPTLEDGRFPVPPTAKFARVAVKPVNGSFNYYDDKVVEFKIYQYNENNDIYKQKDLQNFGIWNTFNRMTQFADIGWKTAAANMPTASKTNKRPINTVYRGVPYSSPSFEDGYVGCNVSLYTFMTAVNNPNSCLYNEVSKGYTGYSYYGTVCTGFTCAAWGMPFLVTTRAWFKNKHLKKVKCAEVQLGDMWLEGGHAKMVSEITRDNFGKITGVRLSESVQSGISVGALQTYAQFKAGNEGKMYRYDGIDQNDKYEPSEFIRLMDEPALTFEYPDIVTYYGDKLTRKLGTDIPIHVLNSSGYSSIEVYKDGTKIDTRSVANFTLIAPAVGEYEVRMVGTGKQSSTFFDIVDCSATKSGNNVTVTTTKKLLCIGGYPTYNVDSDGNATTWNNPVNNLIATEAEQTGKVMDISEILADNECNGGLRIYVSGKYGSVSWEYPWSYFE